MKKGIITYYLGTKWTDKIVEGLYKINLLFDNGYYPVTEDKTGVEVMRFICVKSRLPIVKLLGFITQYRGKDSKTCYLTW